MKQTPKPRSAVQNPRIRTIQHAQLGEVRLQKCPRSRGIRISVRADKCVLVTLPLLDDFAVAERFLDSRADWVYATMLRLKEKKDAAQTIFTPEKEFGTFGRRVLLAPEKRKDLRVHITPETVYIYYPEHYPVTEESMQAVIRQALEHAWKLEAHEVLPPRTARLALDYNFHYTSLSIKNSRSYWGLCMPDNSITFSIHLMHLPGHLIDFIILHELCHTVYKNHGTGFWKLLDAVCEGKARAYAREMQTYSTRVY